jgi:hypothetical protein
MRRLSNLLIGGAISLLMMAPAAARAETLLFSWSMPAEGVQVSWEQDSNPTPLVVYPGQYTLVPVFDFHSTGTTVISPAYTDMTWFNVSQGGGFTTPAPAYSFFPVPASQQYTGPESAPVFGPGTYSGTEYVTGATDVTLKISAISVVPELSTWAMMVLGFAGLGFAGYRRNKNSPLAA